MNDTPLRQNIQLIEQGVELLQGMPAEAYTAERSEGSPAPAVGPHFRHCLDFYLCFLDGLELRVIDYGARARQRDVETDAAAAIREFEGVLERLAVIDAGTLTDRVELRREVPEQDGETQWFGSTVGRELQFLLSHTVHHYALVAIGLRLNGVPVPEDFGVAPSTLEHWRREGRVAS